MNGADPNPFDGPIAAKPILDYASPRSHGKLRLPSHSILEWRWADPERRRDLIVIERLRGRGTAIPALVFGVVTLCMLAIPLVRDVAVSLHQNGFFESTLGAVVCFGEVAVMVLVIRNTWRETRLETVDGELRLTFKIWIGLSTRRYCWMPGVVGEVRVVTMNANLGTGELQIFPAGHATVQLFTDHSRRQLDPLAADLRTALRLQ